MPLHHYNCLPLIVFAPVTDVHVTLKRMDEHIKGHNFFTLFRQTVK